jgi:hypothetical protein
VEVRETRPDIAAVSLRVAVAQILEWDSNGHDLQSARSTD